MGDTLDQIEALEQQKQALRTQMEGELAEAKALVERYEKALGIKRRGRRAKSDSEPKQPKKKIVK